MRRESKPSLYADLFHRHADNPILTAQRPTQPTVSRGRQIKDETILLVRVEDRRGHSI